MLKITSIGLLLLIVFSPCVWAQWEGAEVVQITNNQVSNRGGVLYIDNDDKLYMFYNESYPYTKIYLITKEKNKEWSQPKELKYKGASVMDLTAKLLHFTYVTVTGGDRLYYSYIDFEGDNHGDTTLIDSTHGPYINRDMGMDSLGNIHVIWNREWHDTSAMGYYQVGYATNAKGSWQSQMVSPVIRLGLGKVSWYSYLAVEKNGIAHMLYVNRSPVLHICHAQNDTFGGSNWTTDSLVFAFGGTSGFPFWFHVDEDDDLHLLTNGRNCSWDCPVHTQYYYRPKGSQVWAGPEEVYTEEMMYPICMHVDKQKEVHVSFLPMVNTRILYTKRDEGNWPDPQVILHRHSWPSYFYYINAFSFVIDSDGKGHGAFAASMPYPDPGEMFYFGSVDTAVEDSSQHHHLLSFGLHQNYPNPFNTATTIPYELKSREEVNLKIYDLLGREIRSLVHGIEDQGRHWVSWDGKDHRGKEVASGIYFYVLSKQGERIAKQMLFIK